MNFKNKSLFFAPMEGITDSYFRETIQDLYPEWDYLATDFLRIPSVGTYPKKHLIKHFGKELINNKTHLDKTIYQILVSQKSHTAQTVTDLAELGFNRLDLNLGCPSKTVCKRLGGSYLLSDLKALRTVIKEIRQYYPGFFSTKIRVGFKDDKYFLDILKLLSDEGVQTIIIHGRTREQLYKGVANWNYIEEAKKVIKIPVIGNGDIWTTNDIESIFEQTNCDGAMIARGALKKPWLAKEYYSEELEQIQEIQKFFNHYQSVLTKYEIQEQFQHKRFKGLTRYMFDDLKDAEKIKRSLYLSSDRNQYLEIISSLGI